MAKDLNLLSCNEGVTPEYPMYPTALGLRLGLRSGIGLVLGLRIRD